jgi:hypothetical protein
MSTRVLFLATAAAGLLGTAVHGAPLQQATITKMVNKVEIIPGGGQPEPASLGDVIDDRTGVRTGSGSRAQLTFNDQTIARLGANTLFSFDRGTRNMDLENGTILLQVPKGAGDAEIRSAPIVAAITGTTVMMSYVPGNPGTIKLIVLETKKGIKVRVKLQGRFGESVLISPGEMLAVPTNATSLPNPVPVDIQTIMRTARLVQEGELESMGLILEVIEDQQQDLQDGTLVLAPTGPAFENADLSGINALNVQNQLRNTVPGPTPPPTPPRQMLPPPTPPPTPVPVPTPPPTPVPTPPPTPPHTPPYTPPYTPPKEYFEFQPGR